MARTARTCPRPSEEDGRHDGADHRERTTGEEHHPPQQRVAGCSMRLVSDLEAEDSEDWRPVSIAQDADQPGSVQTEVLRAPRFVERNEQQEGGNERADHQRQEKAAA